MVLTVQNFSQVNFIKILIKNDFILIKSNFKFSEHLQSIPADRLVGPFLTITPEFCLVAEDGNKQIIGYACAALDAKAFYRNQEVFIVIR